jgi:oxygen-independent coproporphyrinogen III oxidase
MVRAIAREAELQKHFLHGESVETLYFGGGTPSILELPQLERILQSIDQHFSIQANAEITLEANPEDLSAEKLRGLKAMGVNRLSIGTQSFNDEFLHWLNRVHDSGKAISAIENSRKAGFENLSIDLIFAIPHADHSIWYKDVAMAVELAPDHLSAYHLTVEPNTVFGNWLQKRKIDIADDQFAAEQFEHLYEQMSFSGYDAYEISNYALNGRISRHNSSYWFHKPYLGLGPGAHSFNGIKRQHNIYNNPKYIKAIETEKIPMVEEILSPADLANEIIMTSLRTKWGLRPELILEKSGYDVMEIHAVRIEEFINEGMLLMENEQLTLSRKGRLFADTIAAELFIAG